MQMNENSLKFNSKYFKAKMAIWQARAALRTFYEIGVLDPLPKRNLNYLVQPLKGAMKVNLNPARG